MHYRIVLLFVLFYCSSVSLIAQSHVSVPLDSSVYYILEQAEVRGLINTLPTVRPYSQSFIVEVLEKILDAQPDMLSDTERAILERELERYKPAMEAKGLDLRSGSYSFSAQFPGTDTMFTGDAGLALQMTFAGAHYDNDLGTFFGMENLLQMYTRGDIGESISYDFNLVAALVRAPRMELGMGSNFYDGFTNSSWGDAIERPIPIYSQPLTFFPYTFKQNWDGGYFLTMDDLSHTGFIEWPDTLGIGPHILSEISGSHLGGALSWRFGRIRREWAGMSLGQSLTLNSMAQPFVGLEASFRPVSWFGFSAMTGVLEYVPTDGDQRAAAWGSQTLFSIEQFELNYKNYVHFGFGTTTVWAKRMELGYLFPLVPNFIYQSYVGDYDNSGLFVNLRGQLPGIGRLWFSLFIDDLVPATLKDGSFWELDWNQFAYQVGARVPVPWFGSFTSVVLSYTKNEPYNYTHRRIFAPWHNSDFNGKDLPLETAYVNNGVSLGYYIPPNSDEFLFRIETMPTISSRLHVQYQIIRHGAAHGSRAVDGSHLLSELNPSGRTDNPVLRKFFLKDGAYQWMHIAKIGGEFALPQDLFGNVFIPTRIFFETGFVLSYYTDIDSSINPNSGSPNSYSRINTSEYPLSTGFIVTFGIRFFR